LFLILFFGSYNISVRFFFLFYSNSLYFLRELQKAFCTLPCLMPFACVHSTAPLSSGEVLSSAHVDRPGLWGHAGSVCRNSHCGRAASCGWAASAGKQGHTPPGPQLRPWINTRCKKLQMVVARSSSYSSSAQRIAFLSPTGLNGSCTRVRRDRVASAGLPLGGTVTLTDVLLVDL